MKITSRVKPLRIFMVFLGVFVLISAFVSCSSKTTPQSRITEYPIPVSGSVSYPGSIRSVVYSPDGVLWFTEPVNNSIGKYVLSTGVFSTYIVPTMSGTPDGILVGTDGNIWFTEHNGNKIGKLDKSTGKISEYSIPTASSLLIRNH